MSQASSSAVSRRRPARVRQGPPHVLLGAPPPLEVVPPISRPGLGAQTLSTASCGGRAGGLFFLRERSRDREKNESVAAQHNDRGESARAAIGDDMTRARLHSRAERAWGRGGMNGLEQELGLSLGVLIDVVDEQWMRDTLPTDAADIPVPPAMAVKTEDGEDPAPDNQESQPAQGDVWRDFALENL